MIEHLQEARSNVGVYETAKMMLFVNAIRLSTSQTESYLVGFLKRLCETDPSLSTSFLIQALKSCSQENTSAGKYLYMQCFNKSDIETHLETIYEQDDVLFYGLVPVFMKYLGDGFIGSIKLIEWTVSMVSPSSLFAIKNALLCGEFRLFGPQLASFCEQSTRWTSFEQFAAWQFLEAELLAQSQETYELVGNLLSHFHLLTSPESRLGLSNVFSSLVLTERLCYSLFTSVNDESDFLIAIMIQLLQRTNLFEYLIRLLQQCTEERVQQQNKRKASELFNDQPSFELDFSVERMQIILNNVVRLLEVLQYHPASSKIDWDALSNAVRGLYAPAELEKVLERLGQLCQL